MKKSQISMFLIVGVILLIIIATFSYLLISKNKYDLEQSSQDSFLLEPEQNKLDALIKHCVKQTVVQAELSFGIHKTHSGPLIAKHVEKNLNVCLNDFETFVEQGYIVKTYPASVKIDITNEAIVADVSYPIELSKGKLNIKFDKQTYRFSRIVMEKINPDGVTRVVSADGSMILEMEQDTDVTLDGRKIDEIGIKLLDRGFNGNTNSVLAGQLAFSGIPHGAKFSKPVKITHFYKQDSIDKTISEESLRLGYYDDNMKIWVSLPAIVDTEKNKIEIETTHFSPYGVLLRCGTEGSNKIEIETPILAKERCGPCNDEYWLHYIKNDDKNTDEDFITEISEIDVDNSEITGYKLYTTSELLESREINIVTYNEDEDPKDNVKECTTFDYEDTEYYGYQEIESLTSKTEFEIIFDNKGNSCIASENLVNIEVIDTDDDDNDKDDQSDDFEKELYTITKDNLEIDESQQTEEDKSIIIECLDFTDDDICDIDPPDEKTNFKIIEEDEFVKLKFNFKLTNNNDPSKTIDACLSGKSKITLNGFGIKNDGSHITCSEEIFDDEDLKYQYISPVHGNPKGECSECIFDENSELYLWKMTNEGNCKNDNDECDENSIKKIDGECQICKRNDQNTLQWTSDLEEDQQEFCNTCTDINEI
jgi:hypothetical protein